MQRGRQLFISRVGVRHVRGVVAVFRLVGPRFGSFRVLIVLLHVLCGVHAWEITIFYYLAFNLESISLYKIKAASCKLELRTDGYVCFLFGSRSTARVKHALGRFLVFTGKIERTHQIYRNSKLVFDTGHFKNFFKNYERV